MPNRLSNETSPYLLQHANNPVNWYPWGEEAFEKARKEDKPILVSIGYAACHWCHVMEHESFEDEATAKFMNAFFVNIKVDREERPDVDHIYMNACQLLTGAGGWPLNVFLTPELLPFSGGTYFPPKPGYGKPSWLEVLTYMKTIFATQRDKVEEQADSLKEHMVKMDNAFLSTITIDETRSLITKEEINNAIEQLQSQFDLIDGGFGSAPKFPGTMPLLFLLRSHFFMPDDVSLKHIHLSLKKMMLGGLFDHVGGGFSRYTVDKKWMIPHFEKMLYDNALLVGLYAEAFQITRQPDYKIVIDKTLAFVLRDLMNESYGFYASYDADSEGEEGKFYTYTTDELRNILQSDFNFAKAVYNITDDGNWEHTNILFRTETNCELALKYQLTEEEIVAKLNAINALLFNYRKQRVLPGLDDKIILSWNALMCFAFVQAFKATQNELYRSVAEKNIQFLLSAFANPEINGAFLHTCKNGEAKFPAFIEDYAAIIQALLAVNEITGNDTYLQQAICSTEYVITHFSAVDGMFYFTINNQTDIPYRSRDFYDNATPSGNSMMMQNLNLLFHLTGIEKYRIHAEKMLIQIKLGMLKHGTSFGNWLCAALPCVFPFAEIGITGKDAANLHQQVLSVYYPHTAIQVDETGLANNPLVAGRFDTKQTQLFLCRNNVCLLPVTSVQDFVEQLNKF